jgi:hypothetical protein
VKSNFLQFSLCKSESEDDVGNHPIFKASLSPSPFSSGLYFCKIFKNGILNKLWRTIRSQFCRITEKSRQKRFLDTTLASSDSEMSPPLKYLDPAHMPSPRMLHVLKRTVVNNEIEDEPWSVKVSFATES